MKCSRLYIALLFLVSLLFSFASQAQDSLFDAMVNEKMTEFTLRDFWQKPDSLLKVMQIQPAEHIAEIGAGEGYFSVRLAKEVGPDGKLLAIDESERKLNVMKLLKRYSQLDQLEIRKSSISQLKLDPGSLDKIVMLGVYHQLSDYEMLLKRCMAALKPGGTIYIIDRCEAKQDNDKAVRKKLFKKQSIRLSMVEADLKTAGFQTSVTLDKYTQQNGKINWFMIGATKN